MWVKMDGGCRCLDVSKGWRVADGDGVMVSGHGWSLYVITYLYTLPKWNKNLKFTVNLVKMVPTNYF